MERPRLSNPRTGWMRKGQPITIIIPCILLYGCLKAGPELRETATVTQTHFVAPQTSIMLVLDDKGSVSMHSVTTSPEYWVAFRCQHGQFAVSDHRTWEAVHPGETWTIVYRELSDKHGTVVKFKFVRVEPIGVER
jgi:hypothetical protein